MKEKLFEWSVIGVVVTFVVAASIAGVLALVFGFYALLGWFFYLTYGAVAPDSWVPINYWPSVGIMFITSVLLSRVSGASVKVERD
ncbi:hypothetical protein LCGC14_2166370 [marine sediment metagenome]|uniref:Uncharacterized protein n=1 Tax=marine sediment metagenome TaxID=412755 RepID=A0A0F9DR89_9ZZZZ